MRSKYRGAFLKYVGKKDGPCIYLAQAVLYFQWFASLVFRAFLFSIFTVETRKITCIDRATALAKNSLVINEYIRENRA